MVKDKKRWGEILSSCKGLNQELAVLRKIKTKKDSLNLTIKKMLIKIVTVAEQHEKFSIFSSMIHDYKYLPNDK